jgi:hypothetical protein
VYLHSQSNDLGEQNGRQHNQVLIAAEECVHTLRCFGKRKPWNCHDERSEASAFAIIENSRSLAALVMTNQMGPCRREINPT